MFRFGIKNINITGPDYSLEMQPISSSAAGATVLSLEDTTVKVTLKLPLLPKNKIICICSLILQ